MKAILLCLFASILAIPQPALAQSKGTATPGLSVPAAGEQRVALVIGNGQYKDAPLSNPVNDARAIAKALTESGFKVTRRENAGQKELQLALRDFGDALKAGGVGLFYYAGHGMQVKGRNFLIPVDAQIQREDEVAYNSVDVGQVLDKMEAASNRLNILILDACRNNPFARSFRSASVGLAQMDAPVGTLIAFATAPGSVASDGDGQNGLYTQHLLQSMQKPGAKIEDVFKNVRAAVRKDSGNKQVPWESTSLEGDFIFVPQPPAVAKSAAAGAGTPQRIDSITAPVLTVGDAWDFQVIDMLSGSVAMKFTRRLTAITADEYRFGNYITDTSLNGLRRLENGKVVQTWSPKRVNHDFPLHAGKAWKGNGLMETPQLTSEHAFEFRVLRQEQIIVPAGLFDTLRIEGTTRYKTRMKKDGSSGEGTNTFRIWYSPVADNFAAMEFEQTNWKGVVSKKERLELLAIKREGRN
jgi:hypothetical protein